MVILISGLILDSLMIYGVLYGAKTIRSAADRMEIRVGLAILIAASVFASMGTIGLILYVGEMMD